MERKLKREVMELTKKTDTIKNEVRVYMYILDNVAKLVDITDLARLKKTEELRRNDMEGAKGS